jgi:hypothetical protein
VYRRFGEGEGAKTSPVYGQISTALSGSVEALKVIEAIPARKRQPSMVLAALHDVALSGQAPDLAAAFGISSASAAATSPVETAALAGEPVDTAALAVEALVTLQEMITGRIVARRMRGDEDGRHALLYPVIADAARRAGAGRIGLIDVGRSAGLNLTVDRVAIGYGNGQVLGDSGSRVRVTASVVGEGSMPEVPMPRVATRVAVGPDLVDVTDPDEARWLRACVPPDRVERLERLGAEIELAAAEPPALVHGEVVDVLPEAIAAVPVDVMPVVITTWVLSRLSLEERLRFLQQLDQAATQRAVAWVSVEGVGVAPGVPTFGDRPASGHSILGVSLFEHSSLHSTAVGRAWLRGEMLSWLARR